MIFNNQDKVDKKITNDPSFELKIDTLSLPELEEAISKRISVIKKEFVDGFNFIKKYPKSVTFFGSARFSPENPHYIQAMKLAALLAKDHYAIVTGGGPGIMQAANQGAASVRGKSLGLAIELPHEQVLNPYLTDYVGFYYFFIRKVCLSFSAEAFVYFPGGFGTLDELFEVMTLIQTKKIPQVPIILVGKDFWQPLENFIREHMYGNHRTIDNVDLDLFCISDDLEEILAVIKKNPVKVG